MLWNYESVSVWLSSWRHRPHYELFSKNRTSKHYLHWGPSPLRVSLQGDMASSNRNRCCLLFVPPLVHTPLEPRMLLPLLGAQTRCSTNSPPPNRDGEWFKFLTRQGLLTNTECIVDNSVCLAWCFILTVKLIKYCRLRKSHHHVDWRCLTWRTVWNEPWRL